MKPKFLKRAHYDENIVVNKYWKLGYPALRVPISGAGLFKGDVLVFTKNTIHLILVRRSESSDKVVFKADEIKETKDLAGKLAALMYPNTVLVELYAHFPRQRKWVEKLLVDWDGKDIAIEVKE
jgi:Holliday junction resolvase